MNAQIAAYEQRLRNGAEILEQMESTNRADRRYERALRHWLELLAAYEYECEMAQSGTAMLAEAM